VLGDELGSLTRSSIDNEDQQRLIDSAEVE